jgi:hypothetical protein
MHSDLDILGRVSVAEPLGSAGSLPPSLSSALGVLNPIKYPLFPTLVRPWRRPLGEDSLTLRYPATDLGTGSVGVSTGENR